MGDEKQDAVGGWVDAALKDIENAVSKGVSLDALPHNIQETIRAMKERDPGKRALGDRAHELDHVKAAHNHVKARMAQIVAGLG